MLTCKFERSKWTVTQNEQSVALIRYLSKYFKMASFQKSEWAVTRDMPLKGAGESFTTLKFSVGCHPTFLFSFKGLAKDLWCPLLFPG